MTFLAAAGEGGERGRKQALPAILRRKEGSSYKKVRVRMSKGLHFREITLAHCVT